VSFAVRTIASVALFTAHMEEKLTQMDAQLAIVKPAMDTMVLVVVADILAVVAAETATKRLVTEPVSTLYAVTSLLMLRRHNKALTPLLLFLTRSNFSEKGMKVRNRTRQLLLESSGSSQRRTKDCPYGHEVNDQGCPLNSCRSQPW
jgi:hypothetical protein